MPFTIIRNDITRVHADAIVNAANREPIVGWGVDAGIHKKAGAALLKARQAIGRIPLGDVAVTPAFRLNARYVLHAVSPAWQGGHLGEAALLAQCYRKALQAATAHGCESIAFPLLGAGNLGFPPSLALETAIREIRRFLLENDMQVYLVVFDRDVVQLSQKLHDSITSYIDENYVLATTMEEYGLADTSDLPHPEDKQLLCRMQLRTDAARREARVRSEDEPEELLLSESCTASAPPDWNALLADIDAGFSQTLLALIDRTGKKDSEIYRKANLDRRLFSKIRNNPHYRPTKATALAFAMALELDLEETLDFIGRAGYTLTHSSKSDIIVEYFIQHGNYDIFALNAVLYEWDLTPLGD